MISELAKSGLQADRSQRPPPWAWFIFLAATITHLCTFKHSNLKTGINIRQTQHAFIKKLVAFFMFLLVLNHSQSVQVRLKRKYTTVCVLLYKTEMSVDLCFHKKSRDIYCL